MEVLIISLCAPYKGVGHAGGKTHYYYWNGLRNNDDIHVKLISHCDRSEIRKLNYGLEVDRILHTSTEDNMMLSRKIIDLLPSYFRTLYPVEYYRKILTDLTKLQMRGYRPDVILLEWTQIVFLVKKIKKIFPNANIIASEYDVTFLGAYRRVKSESNFLKKMQMNFLFKDLLRRELSCVNACERVIVQNKKDAKLLLKCGVKKERIWNIIPYYDDYSCITRMKNSKNIIFYGAMSREENYLSAIWFIKNVLPYIKDKEVKFIIIGSKPAPELQKYKSDRVIITGFVDTVSPYFEDCLCMVAPLIYGAGIKVKCIEALSAGVPLLTNKIGVEGIYAKNGVDYFFCESAKDYIDCIDKILSKKIDINIISDNSRRFIEKNFNINKSLVQYVKAIKNMNGKHWNKII